MDTISNNDDIIDSRNVIERIEELEEELQSLTDAVDEAEEGDERDEAQMNLDCFDKQELLELKELASDACSSPDWEHGESLIRDSYFVEYIKELIHECYDVPENFESGTWPWNHMKMDYDAAAEEAKIDYTSVEFGGVQYWIRS